MSATGARHSSARKGIAFETVFSQPDKVDFLSRAKDVGYFIRVFFIGTSDPRINAARVAGRVLDGADSVPIEKIVSRHVRSIANLSAAFRLADRVYVYDNSVEGQDARLLARSADGLLRKIFGPLPDWIAEAVASLEHHPEFVDLRDSQS
jgi:predicted ABC-type ATPase